MAILSSSVSGSTAVYNYPGVWADDPYKLTGTFVSATFTGDTYSVVFGPSDISKWSNVAITLVNNSVNNLKSGSVEFSPNASHWEALPGNLSSAFNPLTSSGVGSMQVTGNSRRYLRIRAIPSGTAGGNSGSLGIFVHVN
jgi:hypothetical protein